jgi:hypothetical protein
MSTATSGTTSGPGRISAAIGALVIGAAGLAGVYIHSVFTGDIGQGLVEHATDMFRGSAFPWGLAVVGLALAGWLALVVFGKARGNTRWIGAGLSAVAVLGPLVVAVTQILGLLGVVVMWIGLGKISQPEKVARVAELASSREEMAHAERVRQIQEWEKAYRDAHNGAEPPAGFMPPIAAATGPAAGTANTFAILALIFGFLGGLIAIPFGFVALSQTKKTGQSGRGMAIAGIILAFVWIAASVALIVVAATSGNGY